MTNQPSSSQQPTDSKELRNILFELWRNGRDQNDRYLAVDKAEELIQAETHKALKQFAEELIKYIKTESGVCISEATIQDCLKRRLG